MAPLNFPCPSCGSMVSTVGLAPGMAPSCSGCGRAFPVPAAPAPYTTGTTAGAAGCGVALVAAILLVVFGGIAFMLFTVRSGASREAFRAVSEAESSARRANAERVRRLAAQLEDPDPQKSLNAWHAIAGCDAADHWGTFAVLDDLFARTRARNALWHLCCGFQMYYDQKGQDAIARELVARKGSEEEVDLLCQALEQYPPTVERDFGAAKGAEVRGRALKALSKAEAMTDRPQARMRIGLALERVRSQQPAEKR